MTSYIGTHLYAHSIRSANKNLLAVPSSRTILADKAFSRAAPTALECSPLICYLCKYLSFIQKSSQNPFISAGPRHIIRKSAPLNLVLLPRIMALYKFTYLLTYLLTYYMVVVTIEIFSQDEFQTSLLGTRSKKLVLSKQDRINGIRAFSPIS